MSMPIGGRGKKAPYETSVLRIPVPLVPKIQSMIDDYRNLVVDGQVSEIEKYPKIAAASTLTSYSEALEEAKKIVKSKKSSAESLAKLLQVLYGGTVSKEDLK